MEPSTIDSQGDCVSKTEIRKAAHNFMLSSQRICKEHSEPVEVSVVESGIAPVDYEVNGQLVRAGSWVLCCKIHDPEIWQAVKDGDLTGLSIAGSGKRTPIN